MSAWYGLLGPAGTPRPIIQTINQQVKKALQARGVQQQLDEQGSEPVGSTPDEFTAFIAAEMKKWGAAVKTAGAKVD